jgi:hypothetical protein
MHGATSTMRERIAGAQEAVRMDLDPVILSRIQFGFVITIHII